MKYLTRTNFSGNLINFRKNGRGSFREPDLNFAIWLKSVLKGIKFRSLL